MELTKTLSFKEVHLDLENESLFLKNIENTKDFKEKGDFLNNIGFSNSIATKLYLDVVSSQPLFEQYALHYPQKLILKPQLERICEKYNLYVRPLVDFVGDIPAMNIKEMQNFKICTSELPENIREYLVKHIYNDRFKIKADLVKGNHKGYNVTQDYGSYVPSGYDYFIPISEFHKLILGGQNMTLATEFLSIAAVESLFTTKSMENKQRILEVEVQREPTGQVDIDPIVLFRTKDGYLILTAWGDEANDELVFNQSNN